MVRVLIFLGLVLALGFGFAWLADRPGTVAVDWMGYQIELSAMIAMIGLLGLIVAVMVVWWIVKTIIRSPQIMGGYFSSRRRDRGYDALSNGLVAAGSGDIGAAQRYAKQAKKLAPDAPLTQVLSASSADLLGDGDAKRIAYRKMLDDPKTQLLGLRGLYVDAVSADDEEAARHYADQAAALAPALAWAGEAQFEDQVQRGDWPAARAALDRNLQARIVSKTDRNRQRAVLLTAEAIDREAGEPDVAKPLALEAHKLAPDLVPAAAVAGRLLIRANKMTQASKVIESTWKKAQHPELAEVYLYVRPGDAVADRVKRAGKLAQLCAHTLEGELALARTQMEAGKLDEARETLKDFTADEPTQRVCLLMAEIEERDGGDTAAVRGWMARALRAKRDAAWVADGYVCATWEPVSPLSGRLDAFEWRVPVERFSGHDPVAIPADAMNDEGQVMLPARLPGLVAAGSAGTALSEVTPANDAPDLADNVVAADAVMVDATPAKETATEPKVEEAKPVEVVATAEAAQPLPAQEAKSEPPAQAATSDPATTEAQAALSEQASANENVESAPEPAAQKKSDEAALETPTPPDVDDGGDGRKVSPGLPRGKAPDDPGLEKEEESADGERKRFRLF